MLVTASRILERPSLRALAIAVAMPLVVTALKLALYGSLGRQPFLLYFAAVVVASWQGGFLAGALATALAAVLGSSIFHPTVEAEAPSLTWLRAAVFAAEALSIAFLTGWLQYLRTQAASAARDTQLSLAKLEAVLAGVSHGIHMQDSSGRLVYANAIAAQLVGFSGPEEFLAASDVELSARYEVVRADGSPLARNDLPGRRVLRGEADSAETVLRFRRRSDGYERWLLVRASAVRMPGGEVPFAVNVIQDLTESRARDAALQLSHEWFATALRSIGDAVIATASDGRITFMNPLAEQLTGYTFSEANGKPLGEVFRIIHEDTREPVENPAARVMREGRVVGLANHALLLSRDGREICIDDSAAPIRAEDGALAGTVMVFRDVSAKRADERLRAFLSEATRELNSSLDYTQTLRVVAKLAVPTFADWCVVDLWEGEQLVRVAVEHTDPAKRELLFEIDRRFPADPNLQQGRFAALRHDRPDLVRDIQDSFLQQVAQSDEHLEMLRSLKVRCYISVPLRAQGQALGVISVAMGESGRDYEERDLLLANELADRAGLAVAHARAFQLAEQGVLEAEHASRTKDEFLALLGHELRNPLAPIVTAVHLMKMRRADLFERERTIIERQVRHLTTLVDDLLDVSRITRGKVELSREAVDLNDTVGRALELAAPLIEKRKHAVVVHLPALMMVDGDPVRLSQVVANLLTNAAKYTPPGGHITITGELGDEVILRVRDDGVGIEAELLPRVFELFVQGRQKLDRAQGGLGLGLAIVRSVVELHGGQVSVRSDGPEHGSEFTVRMPHGVLRKLSSIPVAAQPHGLRARVLVVDDNSDALTMLSDALRDFGHEVRTAEDAASALALAEQFAPEVAVLDIGLPGMDGYELAHRLRLIPGLTQIKLLAVTGYGQASDKARARAAGFDDHLVKPVSMQALRSAIDQLLEPAAAQAAVD